MQQIAALSVEAGMTIQLATTARGLGLTFACILISACASNSPMSRIDSNRAQYESWPIEVQQAVMNGQAKKGMTPEQVEMAMGKPTEIVNRGVKSGEDEIWVYRKGGGGLGTGLLKNTGVSVGGGLGGVNVGTGLGGVGRGGGTPEESEVVFEKGVVVRSDTDK